jgi:ABC-type microcin C transport system permease subunit YejE
LVPQNKHGSEAMYIGIGGLILLIILLIILL